MSKSKQPIIAVFGSARVQPDDPVYMQSYEVGAALARAGYIVMTGGYAGLMAAASQGAAEAGGVVHGITVEKLEAIGESIPNQWLTEEFRYPNLRQRLDHLIDTADAYVTMPGGMGTAQEFIEVWQLMRLGDIAKHPLITYGDFWTPFIEQLLQSAYVSQRDVAYITNVQTTEDLTANLAEWFSKKD
ncbi:MAG: LOG family protein [Anaerolineae bacterium]|nr:LOG family protein [Anaerolineae bacterium]